MKKFASVLLTLALILSLSIPVFAAQATATITVTDDRTYEVYQIFTGDLSGSTLSNIKWGQNAKSGTSTVTAGDPVPEAVLNALVAVKDRSDAEKLAEIEKYVNLDSTPLGTVKNGSSLSAPTGYYLLKDTTVLAQGQERSEYVVKLVSNITVTAKAGEVTGEKKVKDKNDSTGETSEWQDSADYDIGDAVPFKLSGTVSSRYADYETYYFYFHDKLSGGLTFNANSVKVMVGSTDITTSFTIVTNPTDGCTFEVKCNDLKQISGITAGSTITLEYTATLNSNAVHGSAGNDNTFQLEYSNDPNSTSTGKTPEDKVKVFTYKLIVNKVDEESTPLKGAGFTLYKKIKGENNAADTWQQIGNEVKGENLTTFTWTGLDAGDYKLMETTTPPGYNTMADIEFTISSTMDNTGALTGLSATSSGKSWGIADLSAGSITQTIVNNAGTVLPETGASGTTLFLLFGSLLTLAAAVFLTVRKKMSIYER